ncbi:transposase [bacterium]|nr:transposase [bacterium]
MCHRGTSCDVCKRCWTGGWVRQHTADLYGYNGHVSVDPVVIFKILLLGYLYNVNSIRELMRQLDDRLSFRWFIGYDLDEAIPDHSVISKARRRFGPELAELLEYQDVEVWFCDESGVLGDPRPRQRWMRRGEKGRVPFSGQHLRSNVVGAVNPKTGEFFSLMVNRMDGDMFQVFLDQLALETAGRNLTLVLDNATWHHRKSLQ